MGPAGFSIETRPPGYVLRAEPEGIDARCFEKLVAEGKSALAMGARAEASARLGRALALWRGPALVDFAYSGFAQSEITRLEELRLHALEQRAEAELALGRYGDLVPELEGLVADGTLVCWGSAVALVHTEDGYTHSDWFVSDTQAGIVKTLDALRNVGRSQSLVNTTKHRDVMLHSIAHGGKTARTTSGYIRVAFWEAKPGRGDNVEEIFKKYIQPDLDAGVADGSVLMYNFDTEQVHTDAPGGYNLAVVYAGGDGLDKGAATLAARSKENPAAAEAFGAMIDNEAHRDTLSKVLAFQHK